MYDNVVESYNDLKAFTHKQRFPLPRTMDVRGIEIREHGWNSAVFCIEGVAIRTDQFFGHEYQHVSSWPESTALVNVLHQMAARAGDPGTERWNVARAQILRDIRAYLGLGNPRPIDETWLRSGHVWFMDKNERQRKDLVREKARNRRLGTTCFKFIVLYVCITYILMMVTGIFSLQ